MIVNIDLEAMRKNAEELESEIASVAALPEGLRVFYRENEGRLSLDTEMRDAFVNQLSASIDGENLKIENHKLKQDRDRRQVAETVRREMARVGVKPGLMAGAVAAFMAQHRFAVRDGGVVVVGKLGASDAEAAAVQWASNDEVDALLGRGEGDELAGDFIQAVRRMKGLH